MRKQLHKKIITGAVILSMSAMLFACQSKNEDSDAASGTEITSGPEVTTSPNETENPTVTAIPSGEPSVTVEPNEENDATVTGGAESIEQPETADKPGSSEITEIPEVTKTPEVTKAPETTKAPAPTKKPEVTKAPTKAPEATKAPTPTKKPKPTAAPTKAPKPTSTPVPTQEASKDDILSASLSEIMDEIYSNVTSEMPMRFDSEISKDSTSYYFGVENMDIEEALASESMISMPHSVCLARVKDGTDIEALKKEIKEKVNPRKWICVGVEPENVLVDNIGNLVILVMTNSSPQEIMDSFLSLDK